MTERIAEPHWLPPPTPVVPAVNHLRVVNPGQSAHGPNGDDQFAPDGASDLAITSFEHFYRRFLGSTVALCFALTGNRVAAEDLAQEVFVAAYRNWPKIQTYEAPQGWLRRVAANQAVSQFRRRTTELKTVLKLGHQRQPLAELPERENDLWQVVSRLPKRQKQVIALHFVIGYSLPEVALVLECSPETVRTHFRRAKTTLAQKLSLPPGGDRYDY
jgi:RNA polymerase sigma-70 factor (ECF subfamily)